MSWRSGYCNPRSCARSDAVVINKRINHTDCNPRSCARSDAIPAGHMLSCQYCNPRSCARSDLLAGPRASSKPILQPTLLCEERYREWVASAATSIATHAPVRGAIGKRGECRVAQVIATHAPVRGAIRPAGSGRRRQDYCNPRSCARSDSR